MNSFSIKDGIVRIKFRSGVGHVVEADLTLLEADGVEFISIGRWYALSSKNTFYMVAHARRADGSRTKVEAHRLIMGLCHGDRREVDHRDGDGLNNRRSNLRVTDSAGNQHNQRGKHPRHAGKTPTSRYPGVCWNKARGKWQSGICLAGREIHLGRYDVEEDAATAYIRAKAARDAGGTPAEVRVAGWEEVRRVGISA